jgi:hypothetical protein
MRHWHSATGLVEQLSAVDKDQYPVAFDAGGLGNMGEADGLAAASGQHR